MIGSLKFVFAAVCVLFALKLAVRPACAQPAALPVVGGLPDFNVRAQDMGPLFEKSKQRLIAALDAAAALPAGKRTFENTVAAVEAAYADFNEALVPLTFLSQVSADKAVRERAFELEKEVDALRVDFGAREDVYKAVKEYAAKGEALKGEDARLLADLLLNFRRNGLELAQQERDKLKSLRKRLSELELSFQNNVKEDRTVLEAGRKELEGAPPEFLKELPSAGEGRVRVPLDYPHYTTIMETVKSPELRKKAEFLFNNKAADKNIPILKETLEKRRELARLLGYASFAHYQTAYRRMAKSPERVKAFLERLKALLAAQAQKDLRELLELKRQEEPGALSIGNEDVTGLIGQQLGYYPRRYIESKYEVDAAQVRSYFPVDRVVREALSIHEELYGLEFKEVPAHSPTTAAGPADSWHPEVRLFEVRDKASGTRIAWFYLDLYPREGKYNHMAAFDILVGRELPGKGYRAPVSAMVGNFTRAEGKKPALMNHDEVETFFHEFGHIMHQTLTRGRYPRFSGSNTALDFVEAPSQMPENWVWDPAVLERISGHYQDPAKKLPKDLLAKMIAARQALAGLSNLRLVALSLLDLELHGPEAVPDASSVTDRVFREAGYLPPTPGTHFEARFGHIMGGYAAGYYGYLWSRVYAQDMYSRFEKEGVLSPGTGMDYRRKILERGSSIEEEESLKDFLGREPGEEAFLRSLGG
ncbi:MAG: M3 family metallopeptidase [Elusimicrobiota bacterium]|jgi:thimet oligopeptidase